PYDLNNAPENSVGIELDAVYDNRFTNCYSENQEIAILIKNLSHGNIFTNHRFNTGGGREEKIVFGGQVIENNIFNGCAHTGLTTTINVEVGALSNRRRNLFINCAGLIFDDIDKVNVINLIPNSSGV